VLSCYKSLLKTRKLVFRGDENALSITLNKIKEEFNKNRTETNEQKIREVIIALELMSFEQDFNKIEFCNYLNALIKNRKNNSNNYIYRSKSKFRLG